MLSHRNRKSLSIWHRQSRIARIPAERTVWAAQFFLPALLQKLVREFFFDFSQGNLGNLVGILAGIVWDFF